MAEPDCQLLRGDCIEVMRGMAEASVDAIVCDPPYGLEFMGKEWDRLADVKHANRGALPNIVNENGKPKFNNHAPAFDLSPTAARAMQDWHEAWARQALRVLKPGGHMLAFGGSRTYHRLACAIEDAGFEVRDQLQWLYGSGFPKSLDVSKAIDRAAGAEREVVGTWRPTGTARPAITGGHANAKAGQGPNPDRAALGTRLPITAPATAEAAAWDGWGTALKPAHEPICLARKPLAEGTVAENVLAHGTGAINVDGCRIGNDGYTSGGQNRAVAFQKGELGERQPRCDGAAGRWPANVCLDEEAAALLDEAAGVRTSGAGAVKHASSDGYRSGSLNGAETRPEGTPMLCYGDTGGASRFYYTAKASRSERNAKLKGMDARATFQKNTSRKIRRSNPETGEAVEFEHTPLKHPNHHPTVKPLALMRWLCRLITPPGGLVLDPFAGSGSTGVAAIAEGFQFIGIEKEDDYLEIAGRRNAGAQRCLPF